MTSGVGDAEVWDVPDSGIKRFERAVMGGGDVTEVIRSAPHRAGAGERFNYSTFDAQILGWVLEAATGKTLARYADRAPVEPHRRRARRVLLAHPGPPAHRDRGRLLQRHRPRRRPGSAC